VGLVGFVSSRFCWEIISNGHGHRQPLGNRPCVPGESARYVTVLLNDPNQFIDNLLPPEVQGPVVPVLGTPAPIVGAIDDVAAQSPCSKDDVDKGLNRTEGTLPTLSRSGDSKSLGEPATSM